MGIQMSKLRAIAVVYSDGNLLTTNMAAHLSDKEMLEYFAIGKVFNIGSVKDNLQTVIKREIIK